MGLERDYRDLLLRANCSRICHVHSAGASAGPCLLLTSTQQRCLDGRQVQRRREEFSITLVSRRYVHAKSLQLCPTLCDAMNRSLPGSSVHGILQAGIMEWGAMPSSRDLPGPVIEPSVSHVSCTGTQVLYSSAAWEARQQKAELTNCSSFSVCVCLWVGCLLGTFSILVWNVPCPGKPLSPEQPGELITLFVEGVGLWEGREVRREEGRDRHHQHKSLVLWILLSWHSYSKVHELCLLHWLHRGLISLSFGLLSVTWSWWSNNLPSWHC